MLRSYQRQEDRAAQRNAGEEQRIRAATAAAQQHWLAALRHVMFPENAPVAAWAAPAPRLWDTGPEPASGGALDNSAGGEEEGGLSSLNHPHIHGTRRRLARRRSSWPTRAACSSRPHVPRRLPGAPRAGWRTRTAG